MDPTVTPAGKKADQAAWAAGLSDARLYTTLCVRGGSVLLARWLALDPWKLLPWRLAPGVTSYHLPTRLLVCPIGAMLGCLVDVAVLCVFARFG